MTSRETHPRSAADLAVRVGALAALTALVVAVATGTSFARHVAHGGVANPGTSAGAEADTADRPAGASARALLRSPSAPDAQHLMHRLGGCMAVLGAVQTIPAPASSPATAAVATPGAVADAVVGPTWVPPAPSPPTSSPVLRT